MPFFFKEEPILRYYLRKDDSELPRLVGEFHYAHLIYVFIVPFVSDDQKDFCDDGDFHEFWKIFSLTRANLKWDFRDFVSLEQKSIAIKLNLKGMKLGENAFVTEVKEM